MYICGICMKGGLRENSSLAMSDLIHTFFFCLSLPVVRHHEHVQERENTCTSCIRTAIIVLARYKNTLHHLIARESPTRGLQ